MRCLMLFLEQNGYQESGGRITMVKIYGTLGPACQDEKILTEMFALGMTGMRLNLSHVTLAESGELIGKMKWAAESCGGEAAAPDRSSGTGASAQGRLRSQSC